MWASISELPHASFRWLFRITEEVRNEAQDEQEDTESKLHKIPEVNCEKIDKSDGFLSKDLKLENEWQQGNQIWS